MRLGFEILASASHGTHARRALNLAFKFKRADRSLNLRLEFDEAKSAVSPAPLSLQAKFRKAKFKPAKDR